MKNKILAGCFSFLTLYLFACGIAAAVFLGIILMPVFIVTVLVLAIREIYIWRKKSRPMSAQRLPERQTSQTVIIGRVSFGGPIKRTAA